jgi:hypothetical protein
MSDFDVSGFSFTPDQQDRSGSEYPRIWWYNGSKQAGTNGHFFTTEREFPEGIAGWSQVDRYDDEVGYSAEALKIAVIRRRAQAYSEERSGDNVTKTWHSHYKPGLKIYTELLCLIEGYDEPVLWIVKGMTGQAVTKRKVGMLDVFKASVLDEAQKTWKGDGAVPPWAFWMPIMAPKTDKGKPVYTDTGYGSHVTLPVLALPTIQRDSLKALFVNRALLNFGLEVYHATAEWQKAQRGDTPTTPAATPRDESIEPF